MVELLPKERRNRWTRVAYVVGKAIVVPIVVGGLGIYYEYRLKLVKQRDEALYAPMQDFDKRLLAIEANMDLLVKLVAERQPVRGAARPQGGGVGGVTPHEDILKNISQRPSAAPRALPDKLDDFIEQRTAKK